MVARSIAVFSVAICVVEHDGNVAAMVPESREKTVIKLRILNGK